MKKYYYNDGKAQYGPFSLEELKPQINRETPIWYEGMNDWKPAKDVPEVSAVLPPPIVQSATPPPFTKTTEPTLRIIEDSPRKELRKIWTRPILILGVLLLFAFGIWFWQMMTGGEGGHYDPCEYHSMTNDEFISGVRLGVNYREIPFGGVQNVVVTVSNQLSYTVEEATIIVSYVRSSGDSEESEILNLHNLTPGETQTLSANGASRGVKAVVYFSKASIGEACYTYNQPDS